MIHLRVIPDPEQVRAEVLRDLEETKLLKNLARSPDKVERHRIEARSFHQNGANDA